MTSLWLDGRSTIADDPLPLDAPLDDLVVGAGLTGLVSALLLARAGRRVAVVEARHVGAVTTGNTTAKLSLLQGTHLSRILGHQSQKVAQAYVEANREGMEWLLRFCDDHGVDVQRRPAVTYAASGSERSTVERRAPGGQLPRPAGALGGDARRPLPVVRRDGARGAGPVRPDGRPGRARGAGPRPRRHDLPGPPGPTGLPAREAGRPPRRRLADRGRAAAARHRDAHPRPRPLLRQGRAAAVLLPLLRGRRGAVGDVPLRRLRQPLGPGRPTGHGDRADRGRQRPPGRAAPTPSSSTSTGCASGPRPTSLGRGRPTGGRHRTTARTTASRSSAHSPAAAVGSRWPPATRSGA